MGIFFSTETEEYLIGRIAQLDEPVVLTQVVDPKDPEGPVHEMKQFMDDVAALSPHRIRVETTTVNGSSPLMRIATPSKEAPITFWGTPSGHILQALLTTLDLLGGRPPSVAETAQKILADLKHSVRLDIFVSPT